MSRKDTLPRPPPRKYSQASLTNDNHNKNSHSNCNDERHYHGQSEPETSGVTIVVDAASPPVISAITLDEDLIMVPLNEERATTFGLPRQGRPLLGNVSVVGVNEPSGLVRPRQTAAGVLHDRPPQMATRKATAGTVASTVPAAALAADPPSSWQPDRTATNGTVPSATHTPAASSSSPPPPIPDRPPRIATRTITVDTSTFSIGTEKNVPLREQQEEKQQQQQQQQQQHRELSTTTSQTVVMAEEHTPTIEARQVSSNIPVDKKDHPFYQTHASKMAMVEAKSTNIFEMAAAPTASNSNDNHSQPISWKQKQLNVNQQQPQSPPNHNQQTVARDPPGETLPPPIVILENPSLDISCAAAIEVRSNNNPGMIQSDHQPRTAVSGYVCGRISPPRDMPSPQVCSSRSEQNPITHDNDSNQPTPNNNNNNNSNSPYPLDIYPPSSLSLPLHFPIDDLRSNDSGGGSGGNNSGSGRTSQHNNCSDRRVSFPKIANTARRPDPDDHCQSQPGHADIISDRQQQQQQQRPLSPTGTANNSNHTSTSSKNNHNSRQKRKSSSKPNSPPTSPRLGATTTQKKNNMHRSSHHRNNDNPAPLSPKRRASLDRVLWTRDPVTGKTHMPGAEKPNKHKPKASDPPEDCQGLNIGGCPAATDDETVSSVLPALAQVSSDAAAQGSPDSAADPKQNLNQGHKDNKKQKNLNHSNKTTAHRAATGAPPVAKPGNRQWISQPQTPSVVIQGTIHDGDGIHNHNNNNNHDLEEGAAHGIDDEESRRRARRELRQKLYQERKRRYQLLFCATCIILTAIVVAVAVVVLTDKDGDNTNDSEEGLVEEGAEIGGG